MRGRPAGLLAHALGDFSSMLKVWPMLGTGILNYDVWPVNLPSRPRSLCQAAYMVAQVVSTK